MGKKADRARYSAGCVSANFDERTDANKNNGVIISVMKKLHNPNIHYILCGIGEKQTKLQEQADKAGLHDNVHFLGYRNDAKDLYEASDCFVMPSFRERLSRSIMGSYGKWVALRCKQNSW